MADQTDGPSAQPSAAAPPPAGGGPVTAVHAPDRMPAGAMLGRYRIKSLLGTGKAGIVYLADDTMLKRPVAVKLLHAPDLETRMRFQREAKVTSGLNHKNVVSIYDVGEYGTSPYIVMEFVNGGAIEPIIQKKGPFSPADVARVGIQASRALQHIHEKGIVHRDVTPGNLFLTTEGVLKLGDLGLARRSGTGGGTASSAQLTRVGAIVGTPEYTPPELCGGGEATPASDVYSLALTLYFLLTGEAAFKGKSQMETLFQQCSKPLPDLKTKVPGIPPALEAALLKATQKAPADRQQTAAEFAADLMASLPGQAPLQPGQPAPSKFGQPGEGSSYRFGSLRSGMDSPQEAPKPVPAPVSGGGRGALVAVLLLLLAGGGGFAAWKAGLLGGAEKVQPKDDKPEVKDPVDPNSLYARLGRRAGIEKFVDDFLGRTMLNQSVNFTRGGSIVPDFDLSRVRGHVINQIGQLTGGPEKYAGRDMKTAHGKLRIRDSEFDACAADLAWALDKNGVKPADKAELLAMLAAYRKDIVEPPAVLPTQLVNSIGMKLIQLPAGSFVMGSPEGEEQRSGEEKQHEVKFARGFHMGIYEVTQAQYQKVMGENPSLFKGDDLPVEKVAYSDAVKFCEKLSKLPEEEKAGRVYRLPTEAEWEYACRAGTKTAFSTGDALSPDAANFDSRIGRTLPVGSGKANAWGLYDMHGNVWEWCSDWYDSDYYSKSPSADPRGPEKGENHVIRGGSWKVDARYCRSAFRFESTPETKLETGGFRVVMTAQ